MNSAAHRPDDCFTTLGIAPTGDVRAIKRAYARILKTIDLAADPERFARLRADYELALERAPRLAGTRPPSELVVAPAPAASSPPAAVAVPNADAGPPPAPALLQWDLRATRPRDRLANPPKVLTDIDNSAGRISVTAAAAMPPLIPPPRGATREAPRLLDDDDGESAAIAALLDDSTPDRPRLLGAGLLRYGWDRVGIDLGGFGTHQTWLMRLIEERAQWQALAPRQRKKHEALLAPVVAAPPRGTVGDIRRWRLLSETRHSFPLWTAFSAGSSRLGEWQAMAERAPSWKRLAAWSRQRPLLPLILIWILMTVLSASLSDLLGAAAMLPLMVFFGAVQLVLMILMAAAFAGAVLRRMKRKPQ